MAPGRAAQVQVNGDNLAGDVAQLGNVMNQIGTQIEGERLSRQRDRLRVDVTRDLNDLRLEFEQIGDPDRLDAEWGPRVQQLRASYLEGTDANGRARVDQANQPDFGILFDSLANSQSFSVGQRALAGRQSQAEATWVDYSAQAANAAASGTPEVRADVVANADRMLADMVARNIITPEEAAVRSQQLSGDAASAAAVTHAAQDPAGFVAALENGAYLELSPEDRARRTVSAQAEIERRRREEQREADQAAEEQSREIGRQLGDITTIANQGRVSDAETILSDPAVQAHPDFAEAQAAIALRTEQPDWQLLAPAQLRELIEEERGRSIDEPYQAERLTLLERALATSEEQWRADPVARAIELGEQTAAFNVAELPQTEFGTFGEGLAEAVQARSVMAQDLRGQGYTDQVRLFTDAEGASLRAAAAVGQPIDQRLHVIGSVFGGSSGESRAQVEAVINDPTATHVANLMRAGVAEPVLREILTGQEALDAGTVALPPNRARIGAAGGAFQSLFADLPGGDQEQARVMAGADALYAARVRGEAAAEDFDEDVYLQALHEAMGGQGDRSSNQATGGVQWVRNSDVRLPRGVTANQAWAAMQLIGVNYGEQQYGADAALPRLAAAGNGTPILGDPGSAVGRLHDARMVAVGGLGSDRYVLVEDTASGPRAFYVETPDGLRVPYEFSLSKLIEVTQ